MSSLLEKIKARFVATLSEAVVRPEESGEEDFKKQKANTNKRTSQVLNRSGKIQDNTNTADETFKGAKNVPSKKSQLSADINVDIVKEAVVDEGVKSALGAAAITSALIAGTFGAANSIRNADNQDSVMSKHVKDPTDMNDWRKSKEKVDHLKAVSSVDDKQKKAYLTAKSDHLDLTDKLKKKHNINESLNLQEVLKASTPVKTWIDDFINSDDPKFSGKSKEERRKMALGAYYGAQKEETTFSGKFIGLVENVLTETSFFNRPLAWHQDHAKMTADKISEIEKTSGKKIKDNDPLTLKLIRHTGMIKKIKRTSAGE